MDDETGELVETEWHDGDCQQRLTISENQSAATAQTESSSYVT